MSNVPRHHGEAFNAPAPYVPQGLTASAITSRDPTGHHIRTCTESAALAVSADASTFFGIGDEDALAAIADAARQGFGFGWALAGRLAESTHLEAQRGGGTFLRPGLPPALRRFPAALAASLLADAEDPREVAAIVGQAACGIHPMFEGAIGLLSAHLEAVDLARGLVDEDAAQTYVKLAARPDRPLFAEPVSLSYRRPDFDKRGERLDRCRKIAATVLCKWASDQGVPASALEEIGLEVGCTYSAAFSGLRIVQDQNHGEWLATELRTEPLVRAATMLAHVYREPKLSATNREIVAGDYAHSTLCRDVGTLEGCIAAAFAVRAAVRRVVEITATQVQDEPDPLAEASANVEEASGEAVGS